MRASSRAGRLSGAIAALAGAWACASAEPPAPRVVDLTHSFGADTIYWPTDARGFVFERGAMGTTQAGYYYEAHGFRAAEHGGTHLDAPIHFHEGRRHVDEIPVEQLVGPGVRIDVRAAASADRDLQVDVATLLAWERRHGRMPAGAIVLIHTGLGAHWPDREAYLGTAAVGPDAVRDLHFPGLHPDAARWLLHERDIRAVGLDTASIDHGASRLFETHRVLCAANVPALENVAALDALPARGFTVVALPMKISGGSGAPLRIVALFD